MTTNQLPLTEAQAFIVNRWFERDGFATDSDLLDAADAAEMIHTLTTSEKDALVDALYAWWDSGLEAAIRARIDADVAEFEAGLPAWASDDPLAEDGTIWETLPLADLEVGADVRLLTGEVLTVVVGPIVSGGRVVVWVQSSTGSRVRLGGSAAPASTVEVAVR